METCTRCGQLYAKRYRQETILHGTCKTLCETCQAINYHEYQKFHSNRSRASGSFRPATMTFLQWIERLDYFKWKCAYCQIEPYTTFEHFIPISLGGGTTPENCVPSCPGCDGVKASKHPDNVTGIPKADIERVRAYLVMFL